MFTTNLKNIAAAATLGAALAVPALAPAQGWDRRHDGHDRYDHRRNTRDEWRNLGIAGGAVGVYGLLSGNRTLAALGLGGGLYSAYRYEQDRRGWDRDARHRYELYRRPAFDYGGHHDTRRYDTFHRDR